jgi:hypothetical protein
MNPPDPVTMIFMGVLLSSSQRTDS